MCIWRCHSCAYGGVHTCACGGVYTYACGVMYTCACREQRTTLAIVTQTPCTSPHTYPQGLSLASTCQGPASLHFSSTGITSTQPYPWIFFKRTGSGDRAEVLELARQARYQMTCRVSSTCLSVWSAEHIGCLNDFPAPTMVTFISHLGQCSETDLVSQPESICRSLGNLMEPRP